MHKSDALEQKILKLIKDSVNSSLYQKIEDLLDELNTAAFDEGFETANNPNIQ